MFVGVEYDPMLHLFKNFMGHEKDVTVHCCKILLILGNFFILNYSLKSL